MTVSTLSRSMYEQTATEAEGRSAHEFADRLRTQAEELQRAERVEGVAEQTRRLVEETVQGPVTSEEMQKAGAALGAAATAVERTVGTTNAKLKRLPSNVAGQAQLNQSGTDTFDAQKIAGEGEELVDEDWALGVARHERFHTEQQSPDADEVTLADGQVVTAHEFVEAGAILAQRGKGLGQLSAEYQAIRANVGSVLPEEEFLALAREGKMREFAERTYTLAS